MPENLATLAVHGWLVATNEAIYNKSMKTVYVETSIISYLTSRPSRDICVAAWQEITTQWWEQERAKYELFTSELVIAEAGAGDDTAAQKRLDRLASIPEIAIDERIRQFAARLISYGGVPSEAEADALHIATASVHELDYLLTWNCRHINNAVAKPVIRSICAVVGSAVRRTPSRLDVRFHLGHESPGLFEHGCDLLGGKCGHIGVVRIAAIFKTPLKRSTELGRNSAGLDVLALKPRDHRSVFVKVTVAVNRQRGSRIKHRVIAPIDCTKTRTMIGQHRGIGENGIRLGHSDRYQFLSLVVGESHTMIPSAVTCCT